MGRIILVRRSRLILPPTVASIVSNIGFTTGGKAVTITGTNFLTATGATIGGSAVGSFTVVNDTTITCTTPSSLSGGAKDVVVTNPAGSGTLSSGFSYYFPFSVTNTANTGVATGGASSGTFSNLACGAAPVTGETRYLVAVIAGIQNATRTINSATIGGISATRVSNASGQGPAGIFIASVPTGTTASVAWVANGTTGGMGCSLFRMINADPASLSAAYDTAAANHSGGLVVLDLDIPAGGAGFGGCGFRDGQLSSWTGLTETLDVDLLSNDFSTTAFGTTSGTPRTVRCQTGTGSPSGGSGCSASFAPLAA